MCASWLESSSTQFIPWMTAGMVDKKAHFYIDEKIYLFALYIVMISCHFADDLFLKSVPNLSIV